MTKDFVIAGASGLVGQETLRQLATQSDVKVVALVRKVGLLAKLGVTAPHISERVFDYENPMHIDSIGKELPCDVLLCCLGSTIKAAGSREAFVRIEHDYPVMCLEALKKNAPQSCYGFVSSTGAGSNAGFYLSNKFSVESKIQDSGLCYVIVRPSILLGDRKEFRLGERVMTSVMVAMYAALRPLGFTKLKMIAALEPVHIRDVAAALIRHSVLAEQVILEGLALRKN